MEWNILIKNTYTRVIYLFWLCFKNLYKNLLKQ